MGQQGFWDFSERHQKLAKQKIFLVELDELIPWQTFRPILERLYDKPRKSPAGRTAINVIVIFKLLVLQQTYNIANDELEYQVNDRLSFMRFLHLELEDAVPDAKTVWAFKDQLRQQGLVEPLFNEFGAYLNGAGYQAKQGQILDATLVPVPKQRNTRAANQQIKQGEVPSDWKDKPHKQAQKDTDARWAKKHGQSYYGYKKLLSWKTC